MSSRGENRVVISAAGSRKTECIVEEALAVQDGRVLITTYTTENQRHILSRIEQKAGTIPSHVSVSGWFAFLLSQCARPYQRALIGEPFTIRSLNFKGRRNRFARKSEPEYFRDSNDDLYRDGVADFVAELNRASKGAVISRLERVFTHVFVDEVQDLVGYDLDVLDLLMASRIKLLLVGDPRQHTFSTNYGPRNAKFRGAGFLRWVEMRSSTCTLEERSGCYRCNQAICDFADEIFPGLPRTTSVDVALTGHDGVFRIPPSEVQAYVAQYNPVTVLRYDKNADTKGLSAMNIGVAKGRTFDRVLVFPTRPMLQYLRDRDSTKLKAPEKLYVAVTRARFSVAFVVPGCVAGPL